MRHGPLRFDLFFSLEQGTFYKTYLITYFRSCAETKKNSVSNLHTRFTAYPHEFTREHNADVSLRTRPRAAARGCKGGLEINGSVVTASLVRPLDGDGQTFWREKYPEMDSRHGRLLFFIGFVDGGTSEEK